MALFAETSCGMIEPTCCGATPVIAGVPSVKWMDLARLNRMVNHLITAHHLFRVFRGARRLRSRVFETGLPSLLGRWLMAPKWSGDGLLYLSCHLALES